jgi:hypothetical protein
MANISASGSGPGGVYVFPNARGGEKLQRSRYTGTRLVFLIAAIFLSSVLFAQNTPQVTGVDPASGKVNDTVTVSGQNLGKESVSAVYLSDDKSDFKATVVEQSAEKIVLKVPQVKSGRYNITIQVGDKLLIKPVRFSVEE